MSVKNGGFYSKDGIELIHFVYTEEKWHDLVTLDLADDCSVSKIASQAAENCSSIQRLVIGENTLTIGEKAFADCKGLQIVKYAKKDEQYKSDMTGYFLELSDGKNLTVQYHAFKNCDKLHTVVFPKVNAKDKKITIEKEAFIGCRELRTVVFPSSGSFDIADDAFSGCDTDRLAFVVTSGSDAERYAREHGFRWVEYVD